MKHDETLTANQIVEAIAIWLSVNGKLRSELKAIIVKFAHSTDGEVVANVRYESK